MKSNYMAPCCETIVVRVNGDILDYTMGGNSYGVDDEHSASKKGFFDEEEDPASGFSVKDLWGEEEEEEK